LCDKAINIKPNFIDFVLVDYAVFGFFKGHSVLGKKNKKQ
jgi:hypothetical protein